MTERPPERAPERKDRRGLGRGLSALMADVAPAAAADQPRRADMVVPIDRIRPNPDQPRRDFAPEALEELAASIRTRGVIQPLIVRPDPSARESFQIVAGERRWRAAQLARLHELPVLVRDLDDTQVLEIAIIENIQRADLNPLEEAQAFQQLMQRFGHTQERLAEALGKSRSHVANLLRLLQLPEEVQAHLRAGRLSAGHARALVTAPDAADLARQVLSRGLSVRELEALMRRGAAPRKRRSPGSGAKDADTRVLEQDLSANLGMAVVIDHRPDGEGRVTIRYKDLDQLDQLCQLLGGHS
jgi:ParB family chromosome partitioning protein